MAEKLKYYTVIAGNHKPQPQLQGFLKKSDGQPAPNAQVVHIAVGKIQIPNYSNVWGRRVIKNPTEMQLQKMNNGSLSVSDSEYKGEIEFLKYGDPNGEGIEVRYLANANTIDKQYQDTVMKLKPRDEDAMIDLDQGLNDFDFSTEGNLIKMLQVHGRNGDSVSRNPEINDHDFIEYSASKVLKKEKEEMVILQTALNLVLGTEGNDEQVTILADIMKKDSKQQPEVLLNEMLDEAKNTPDVVVARWSNMKKEVRALMEDSVELKLLDISQDGLLSYYENEKKAPLITGIESSYKGKQMFNYVLINILDPKIYGAIGKLKNEYNKAMSKI